MPIAVAVIIAVAIAAAADRLALRVAVGQVARRIKAAGAAAAPAVRIDGFPFLTQLAAGRYRHVRIDLAEFRGAGVELSGLAADLADVRAPLRSLLAGHGLTAGAAAVTATIPLAVLGRGLPPGLALGHRDGELAVFGSLLPVPVSGLRVSAGERQISLTPTVLGIPSLVEFVIALPRIPAGLAIESVRVTGTGLTLELRGADVALPMHAAEPTGVASAGEYGVAD